MKNVYVDGVFDLFHEGHINLLKTASSYGRLIVGIHDDKFVESYKRKPFIREITRYEVVRACRYVDEVIEGVGLISDSMIDTLKIDIVIHGDDFTKEQAEYYYKAAVERGIFKFVNYTSGVSSTHLIELIEARTCS